MLGYLTYHSLNQNAKLTHATNNIKQQIRYGGAQLTQKGEIVRSKGEKKIADFLTLHGIEYLYEFPIAGMSTDFYLPKFNLAIEYWGMAEVSGYKGDIYQRNMQNKIAKYKINRITLVSLYPGDLGDLKKNLLLLL